MDIEKNKELETKFYEWMNKFHPEKIRYNPKIKEITDTHIKFGMFKHYGLLIVTIEKVLNDLKSIVITSPNTGKNIMVRLSDFEEKMSWDQAITACKNLGNNWRVPTIEEIYKIDRERQFIGEFNYVNYWTSSALNENTALIYNFRFRKISMSHKKMKLRVRAVYDF